MVHNIKYYGVGWIVLAIIIFVVVVGIMELIRMMVRG